MVKLYSKHPWQVISFFGITRPNIRSMKPAAENLRLRDGGQWSSCPGGCHTIPTGSGRVGDPKGVLCRDLCARAVPGFGQKRAAARRGHQGHQAGCLRQVKLRPAEPQAGSPRLVCWASGWEAWTHLCWLPLAQMFSAKGLQTWSLLSPESGRKARPVALPWGLDAADFWLSWEYRKSKFS